MAPDRKRRIVELGSDIQKRTSHEAVSIKELLGLQLEEAKDSLLTHTGEELIRAQGGAQALDKLLKLVTRPAPRMQGQEQ